MLQNSYDNYTQKPQLNAKLKALRKIIAFVFAINMLITRFFGGPAGILSSDKLRCLQTVLLRRHM